MSHVTEPLYTRVVSFGPLFYFCRPQECLEVVLVDNYVVPSVECMLSV